MLSNVITPMEMQSIDAATLGLGAYSTFNDAGIEGALCFIRITNDSDTDVYISYDGVNDHEFIEAGERIEVYFQANSAPTNYVSKLKKYTVIYIRGNAQSTGYIYVAGYYNE